MFWKNLWDSLGNAYDGVLLSEVRTAIVLKTNLFVDGAAFLKNPSERLLPNTGVGISFFQYQKWECLNGVINIVLTSS